MQRPYIHKISFKKFIPGIAWFFLVVYLTCLPGNKLPHITWIINIPEYDKLIHIGLFGGLTFLFCLPFYRSSFDAVQRLQYFTKIAVAVAIWGLAIEFIQKYWIPGRSFDLLDWAADSMGSLIAFGFYKTRFITVPKRP